MVNEMDSYITLDLETTGLRPGTDRILEIGAIKVINGKAEDSYCTFIDPQMAIPARITEITGITQNMVNGHPGNEEAVTHLVDFCEGLPLLGHNIIFDYSFVKHSAVNLGAAFEKEGVDTLKIAKKVLPDLKSRSLQYLRKFYRIEQEQAHRALDDAKTTFYLYEKLKLEFLEQYPDIFCAKPLCYQVKKQSPITSAQKGYLQDLVKYHKIELDKKIESLTKSEASKIIDGILSSYGRIMR